MTDVTAQRRARNPRGQGERLRDDLIAAAVKLMADAGDPADVSIRGVAKAVGVSPTAAYRHFETRDDLIVAACGANFEEFLAFLLSYFDELDDPFERLLAAGRAYLDFARADPGRYRVLFSNPVMRSIGADKWPDAMAGDTAFNALVTLVQDCLDAGAMTRDSDARYLAFQIWTWLHGIVDLRITHPMMDFPDAIRMIVDSTRALGLERPTRGGAASAV